MESLMLRTYDVIVYVVVLAAIPTLFQCFGIIYTMVHDPVSYKLDKYNFRFIIDKSNRKSAVFCARISLVIHGLLLLWLLCAANTHSLTLPVVRIIVCAVLLVLDLFVFSEATKEAVDTTPYYLAALGNEAAEKLYRSSVFSVMEVPHWDIPSSLPKFERDVMQRASEYLREINPIKTKDDKMFEYEVMREVLFIIVIDPYQKVTIPFNALQVLNRSCFDYLSQDRVGPITLFHKQRLFRLWSATYDNLMDMSELYTPENKEDQKHCFTNVFDLEELFPEKFKKTSDLPAGAST